MSRRTVETGVWLDATTSKPSQGERVLLKIKYEDCPVVGYWGCGEWEICVENIMIVDGDGLLEKVFDSHEVIEYMHIPD